jgi:geranylgeranyl diphosphate synthase type II
MLTDYLADARTAIDQQLAQLLARSDCGSYDKLFDAARYALLGGGKRLRPLLLLAAAEGLGAARAAALPAACAVEMIHTYSLVHDDLPCMDDDDFRRGRPSLHRAFPEGLAVLAGDFLLTYAFEVIAINPLLSPATNLQLVTDLAQSAGGHGMIAGQVMDIEAEGKKLDLPAMEAIHRCKTGALISAAVAMGGIAANASAATMEILRSYGNDLGLAFQIADDLLDVAASMAKRGQSSSSDLLNDKMTYVKLMGYDQATETVRRLVGHAKAKLAQLPGDSLPLQALTDMAIQLEG